MVAVDKADGVRSRMSRDERRAQLLDVARRIVRSDGTDRLTLGRLALAAGVSKPVVYDHFGSTSDLLIALYRLVDMEKVDAFRTAMTVNARTAEETVERLAAAFIQCTADTDGEVHAIGATLAGSPEKDAVLRELTEHSVGMFVAVLSPHTTMLPADLRRLCVALVGSGEALGASVARGADDLDGVVQTFARIIAGTL